MSQKGMSLSEFVKLEAPACFVEMQGEIVDYDEANCELTCAFPVKPEYLNPMKWMQGGFIAAAIDNVFGPLSLLAGERPSATTNMQITYHRPVLAGAKLIIKSRVVKKGHKTLYMEATAVDDQGRLIASANSSWMYV